MGDAGDFYSLGSKPLREIIAGGIALHIRAECENDFIHLLQARLKFGGGLGGHNGLKDITSHCGTQDYWRLRFGIGHPGDRNAVVSYVLKPPRKEEHEAIAVAMDRALLAWPDIARGAFEVATQKINTRPGRAKEATS